MPCTVEEALQGRGIYGDDFDDARIKIWHAEEAEGYSGLKQGEKEEYEYHGLNRWNAFRFLPQHDFDRVLSIGGAWADEIQPIASSIRHLTVLEPSQMFIREVVHGIPTQYVQPRDPRRFPLPDRGYDLVICLSALHHVPNVSDHLKEIARCCAPGGYVILREPTCSMGDWRHPRSGLTRHERGIPATLFTKAVLGAGLEVIRAAPCMFGPLPRIWKSCFKGLGGAMADRILSSAFAWNARYHRTSFVSKLAPSAIAIVAHRPSPH